MSTLIICPACETHYEIAAVLPPEGRKVRCSKCGHTWQATGVVAPAGAGESAPQPQAPGPESRPVVAVTAAMRGFAGIAPAQPGAAAFGAGAQAPAAESAEAEGAFGGDYRQEEPSFGADDAEAETGAETEPGFETDYAEPETGAETEPGFEAETVASFEPETESGFEAETNASLGSETESGFGAETDASLGSETESGFGAETVASFGSETETGFEAETDASVEAEQDVTFTAEYSEAEISVETTAEGEKTVSFEASSQELIQTDADFDTGETFAAEAARFTEEVGPAGGQQEGVPPMAAEAAEFPRDLSAMMMGKAGPGPESAPADVAMGAEPRKVSRAVAAGWGLLVLLLLLILGAMAVAPNAVVSAVPGTARVYAMLGMPVNLRGLAIQDVTYGWTGQGDLEIKGEVVNLTEDSLKIPLIVIALRDENGEELSEWTTEVSEAPLSAGAQAQFWTEIPAPPENVRSVKVRFAKAN